jgi:glycosyltransferase involved in cell wall biosynthesis
MRIVYVTPFYLPWAGGAERHVQALAEELVERGHHVTVLTANCRDPWAKETSAGYPARETLDGVEVVRFPPDGWGARLWRGAIERRGMVRLARPFLGIDGVDMLCATPMTFGMIPDLLRRPADVVTSVGWNFPTAYHAHLAWRLRRFPLVGMPLFHTERWWADEPIHRRMLAACDAVLVSSAHEAAFARSRGARRTQEAGVGIHPERFDPRDGAAIRRRYGFDTAPVVGFIGRQHPSKGLVHLVHAMPQVWARLPEARLLIAGPSVTGTEAVDAALAELGETARRRVVRIDEFPEADKASLYDAMDVLVLPSKDESFGIVYLEAWMCGKPVIGANAGSTPSVIDDGADGVLVDADAPEAIAAAITRVLTAPEAAARMGQTGRLKTLARYTWKAVTDIAENLYRDVAARRGTSRTAR